MWPAPPGAALAQVAVHHVATVPPGAYWQANGASAGSGIYGSLYSNASDDVNSDSDAGSPVSSISKFSPRLPLVPPTVINHSGYAGPIQPSALPAMAARSGASQREISELLEEEVHRLEAALLESRQRLDREQRRVQLQDAEIERLSEGRNLISNHASNLERMHNERDTQIAELHAELERERNALGQRDARLASVEQALADRDAQIARIHDQLRAEQPLMYGQDLYRQASVPTLLYGGPPAAPRMLPGPMVAGTLVLPGRPGPP